MFGFKFFLKNPESLNKQLYAKRPALQKYVEGSFFLEGTNGKGVLFIHGWSCTPYESYWLAEFLNRKGYSVYSVLLSGHGKTPLHLTGIKAEDWIKDVVKGLEELKKHTKDVFVIGNSMGGNLALLLAAKFKEIKGLVLVGTPYKIKNDLLSNILAPIESKIKHFTKKHYAKEYYTFIKKSQHYLSYSSCPTSSLVEVLKIFKKSRKILKQVPQPVFVIQSKEDHIVSKNNTKCLFSKLKNPIKKETIIPGVYHNFFGDPNHHKIFNQIYSFLEEVKEKE